MPEGLRNNIERIGRVIFMIDALRAYEEGQYLVGKQAFEHGRYAEALAIFQIGANLGSPKAQYLLGIMCFDGSGVPKSREMAYEWFMWASKQGHIKASYALMIHFPYKNTEMLADKHD